MPETPDELLEHHDGSAALAEKSPGPSSSTRHSTSRSEVASTLEPSVNASEMQSDSPSVSEIQAHRSDSGAPQVMIRQARDPPISDLDNASMAPSAPIVDCHAVRGSSMTSEPGALQMSLHEFQDALIRIENQLEELMSLPKQVENLQDVPRGLIALEDFLKQVSAELTSPPAEQNDDFQIAKSRTTGRSYSVSNNLSLPSGRFSVGDASTMNGRDPAARGAKSFKGFSRSHTLSNLDAQTRAHTMDSLPLLSNKRRSSPLRSSTFRQGSKTGAATITDSQGTLHPLSTWTPSSTPLASECPTSNPPALKSSDSLPERTEQEQAQFASEANFESEEKKSDSSCSKGEDSVQFSGKPSRSSELDTENSSARFDVRSSKNSKRSKISLSSQAPRVDESGRRRSLLSTRSGKDAESIHGGTIMRRSSSISTFVAVEIENNPRYMFRPNSSLRLLWDSLMILNTIFIWSVIPLYLVYFESEKDIISSPLHVLLLYVFDMLWPIDIALNFRTGFFLNGKLEMDPKLTATHYLKRWLVPDILAAWPLACSSTNVHWIICMLKLGRLVKLVPTISRLQFEFRDMGIFQAKVVISYFLVVHLATCGWRLSLDQDPRDNVSDYSIGALYVRDLYWVMMTMTTIGYGDITPHDTRSRCYAIFLMISGSIAFGAMVSACTHITNALFNDPIENQVSEMMRFMQLKNVPQDLQRLVQRDLRHNMHAHKSMVLNPELTAHLSPAMQRELSLSLLGSTVLRFPLFKDVRRSFLAALAQKHCWLQCLPGDVVIEEGHLVVNLVFLIRGKLAFRRRKSISEKEAIFDVNMSGARALELGNDENAGLTLYDDVQEMPAGAWFGEACLFDQNRICVVTVNAVTDCDLAALAAEDYLQVIQRYPSLSEKHKEIVREIAEGTLSIQELAYKPREMDEKSDIVESKGATRIWSLRPRHKNNMVKGVVPQ